MWLTALYPIKHQRGVAMPGDVFDGDAVLISTGLATASLVAPPQAPVDTTLSITAAQISDAGAGGLEVLKKRSVSEISSLVSRGGVSTDAGNALSEGSDGGVYLAESALGGDGGAGGPVDAAAVQAALADDPEAARQALSLGALAMMSVGDLPTSATGLWESVPFSQTIPLNGKKWMPAQTVGSLLTFTPGASPVAGAECTVRLTADASSVPQFPGFTRAPFSDSWAAIAGTVHSVKFYFDGVAAYYSLTQQVSAPVVIPILGTRRIENATRNILTLNYSSTLATAAPDPSAFTLTSSVATTSVSSVAISGANVVLTLSRSVEVAEVLTITYTVPTANQLKTPTGGLALAFSGLAVTNALVPADGSVA